MSKDKKRTYFERAIEISTSNQNCQDDNWGDWCNLCGEADAELIRLKEDNHKLKNKVKGHEANIKMRADHVGILQEEATDLIEAFSELTKSILDSVSLEYMDEMTDGKMTKAIDTLLAIKD